jgi:hypothetical protein
MSDANGNPNLSVSCLLDNQHQQVRAEHLRAELFSQSISNTELEDGVAYQFPGNRDVVAQLIDFVLFERECCRFFTFELRFEPDRGPVTLSLRGPEGVKEFLTQTRTRP